MSKTNVIIRKALSIALMVTVGSFYSVVTSTAFAQVTPKQVGFLSARGAVSLNGMGAASGATVFSGSQIKTDTNGSAIISLGKLGQVDLGADSELTLTLDAGAIGGHLRAGRATISAPVGIAVNVTTADGIAVADGKQASVLTVDVTNGNTRVASARSEAKVTVGDKVEMVAAGQEVSVGTPQQQSGQQNKNKKKGGAVGFGGLSPVALFTLIVLGVGGAVGGIIAATQGDNTNSSTTGTLSNFR